MHKHIFPKYTFLPTFIWTLYLSTHALIFMYFHCFLVYSSIRFNFTILTINGSELTLFGMIRQFFSAKFYSAILTRYHSILTRLLMNFDKFSKCFLFTIFKTRTFYHKIFTFVVNMRAYLLQWNVLHKTPILSIRTKYCYFFQQNNYKFMRLSKLR